MPSLSTIHIDLASLAVSLISATAGAALAGVGYVIHRWLSGAGEQEKLARYTAIAQLSSLLKAEGFNVKEVEALSASLRGKVRQKEISAALEGARRDEDHRPQSYWTQSAMNARAAASFNTVDAQLTEALTSLRCLVSEEEGDALDLAQAAWERWRELHADFQSLQYKGGSIVPLIRASEAEAVTERRLIEVKADIAQREAAH